MLILTSKTPTKSRPSGLVDIDRSSSLATGLLFASQLAGPTTPYNAATHEPMTFVGSPSVPSGVAPEPNAFYGSSFSRGAAQCLMGGWAPAQWTFSTWARLGATSVLFTAGYNNDEKIDVSAGGVVTGNIRLGAGNYLNPTGPSSLSWNVPYHIVMRYDRVNASIWINGVSGTPVAGTLVTEWGYSTDTFSFPGSYLTGYQWGGMLHGRALSDAEIRALYDAGTSWNLYRASESRTYFNVAAAGGATFVPRVMMVL